MYRKNACILLLLLLLAQHAMTQHKKYTTAHMKIHATTPEGFENAYLKMGDSVFIMIGNCKNKWIKTFTYPIPVVTPVKYTVPKTAFLKVHGNILYNFSYKSYIDTPFAENNLQQHLVQTAFNFVVKDKYPVQMTITNRSSNSPYFKNLTDINLNFNRRFLFDNVKSEMQQKATALIYPGELQHAEQLYANRQQQVQQLQQWVNDPARVKELAREKENALIGETPANAASKVMSENAARENLRGMQDNLQLFSGSKGSKNFKTNTTGILQKKITDSVTSGWRKKMNGLADSAATVKDSSRLDQYNAKKNELVKLQEKLKQQEVKVKQVKKGIQDSVNKINRQVAGLKTTDGLYAFMDKNGIAKTGLTKMQRILLSVNQIGIGRSYVDYSELTVKNVSLSGVNIEMNPSKFYVAFAAGKVNYRFRDFIIKNSSSNLPPQSLYIVRAGVGKKEKNNFIVSFYNGKKSVLNYTPSNTAASVQKVLGISAEARLAINENNYIIAEVAKSSYNKNAGSQPPVSDLMGKTFELKTRTNEAYSIKLFSQYPQTNTRFTAYYKKTGENFQSFNLLPTNINQDAWMARLNQSFWKKRVVMDAAIRKNDFASPIAAPSFSSKTIFKSIQASLRIPKYPFLSVGYYPSSQLSLSNNNVLIENQYNTFNAVMSHSYQFRKTAINTNAVYTKFYNNSSDTGFVYFNASSLALTQSFFLGQLNLQTSMSLTDQKELHLFTVEQMLGYQFNNRFSVSAGLKWSRLNMMENLYGGTAMMNIRLNQLGTLQFNYEKSYLPGYSRVLVPVDLGRMSFYREF